MGPLLEAVRRHCYSPEILAEGVSAARKLCSIQLSDGISTVTAPSSWCWCRVTMKTEQQPALWPKTCLNPSAQPGLFYQGLPIIAAGFLESMNKRTCWSLSTGGLKEDLLVPINPTAAAGRGQMEWSCVQTCWPFACSAAFCKKAGWMPDAVKGQDFS